MKDSQIHEINRAIEQALKGNWIPFGVVIACLAVIVWLFIYILKIKEEQNSKRHDHTDKMMEKLANTQASTELLLERVTTKMEAHDIELRDIKKKIA